MAGEEDVIKILSLEPSVNAIVATWELGNPSGEVDRFKATWGGHGVTTQTCYVDSSGTSTTSCTDVELQTCTLYSVTVQPRNHADDPIGVSGTDAEYTLFEGQSTY